MASYVFPPDWQSDSDADPDPDQVSSEIESDLDADPVPLSDQASSEINSDLSDPDDQSGQELDRDIRSISAELCDAAIRWIYDPERVISYDDEYMSMEARGQLIISDICHSNTVLDLIRTYLLNYPCDLRIDYVFPDTSPKELVSGVTELCELIKEIRRVRPGFKLELTATCEDHSDLEDSLLITLFRSDGVCAQLADLANSICFSSLNPYEVMLNGLNKNSGPCELTYDSIVDHDYACYITNDISQLKLGYSDFGDVYAEDRELFVARLEQILIKAIYAKIDTVIFEIGPYLIPLLNAFLERAASLRRLDIYVNRADHWPVASTIINEHLWKTVPILNTDVEGIRPIKLTVDEESKSIPLHTLQIVYTKFTVISSNIIDTGNIDLGLSAPHIESLYINRIPRFTEDTLSNKSLVYLSINLPLAMVDLFVKAFAQLHRLRRCSIKLLTDHAPSPGDVNKLCSGIMANHNIEEVTLTIIDIPDPVCYSKYIGRLVSKEHPNLRKLALRIGKASRFSYFSDTNIKILTHMTEFLGINVNIDVLYNLMYYGIMTIKTPAEFEALMRMLRHTGRLLFLGRFSFSIDIRAESRQIDELLGAVMRNLTLLPIQIDFPSCYRIPDKYVKYVFERMLAYRLEVCTAQVWSIYHYVLDSPIFDHELTRLVLRFVM